MGTVLFPIRHDCRFDSGTWVLKVSSNTASVVVNVDDVGTLIPGLFVLVGIDTIGSLGPSVSTRSSVVTSLVVSGNSVVVSKETSGRNIKGSERFSKKIRTQKQLTWIGDGSSTTALFVLDKI